jgi:ribonuclease T2
MGASIAKKTLRQLQRFFIRTRKPLLLLALLVTVLGTYPPRLLAQSKGEPGTFDFYLLDMPWGPTFCSIADVSAQCKPHRGFVVHGLWPQNDDGSYPVFCSNESGPMNPGTNLDITPDLKLLEHEWAKHGTCSDVGAKRFFGMEHEAFYLLHTPVEFGHVDRAIRMSPTQILDLFYEANPRLPRGSVIVSCRDDQFTAVEACFSKSVKPIRCQGLHSCARSSLLVIPLQAE